MEYNFNEKMMRLELRKEYKEYISTFKKCTDYNDFFSDSSIAKNLVLVKELHYYCMNDIAYNYDLIKKVRDIAFKNGFLSCVYGRNKGLTFYNFLLIMYQKHEDFNLFNWDEIIEFFNCIIEGEEK